MFVKARRPMIDTVSLPFSRLPFICGAGLNPFILHRRSKSVRVLSHASRFFSKPVSFRHRVALSRSFCTSRVGVNLNWNPSCSHFCSCCWSWMMRWLISYSHQRNLLATLNGNTMWVVVESNSFSGMGPKSVLSRLPSPASPSAQK